MKYYNVEVGDGPGDEICSGPFNSFSDAIRNMSDNQISFYLNDRPVEWVGRDIRGWHGNISSLYVVGHERDDKPTWKNDIRPVRIKIRNGEIKREYDEE